MTCFLGIDIGTSAVRACLIDEDKKPIALVRHSLSSKKNKTSYLNQNPQNWKLAVMSCLRVISQQHDLSKIESIAVDGTSATVLLCDRNGKPLTDALLYNDASSLAQTTKLKKLATHESPAISPTASLPKVMQLSESLGNRKAVIQHQADWITGWLCNDYQYSDENNALKLGYDLENHCWPDWVRSSLPANLQLPVIKIPGAVVGHVCNELKAIGFNSNTKIVAGTTDSTASFLATGIGSVDIGATTLGSTLVLKQLSHTPITDFESGVYSHRLGDAWLVGGASNTGGAVISRYFNLDQIKQLSEMIDPMTPTGLDYYPLLATGERFPVHDPTLLPRLTPRPDDDAEFLKGLFEGIAEIEKQGYERLHEMGASPVQSVITSGGGAVNTVWQAIRSRILGIPVSKAVHTEAAYGAALLAKHGNNLFQKFDF